MSLRYNYVEPGKGCTFPYPIILVHGICSNEKVWVYTQRLAALAGFASYALDLQSGCSHIRSATMGDYRKAIEDLIARIGTPVVLMGHSMGGRLIKRVATENPAVIGCVLIASASTRGSVGISKDAFMIAWKMEYWYAFFAAEPFKPSIEDARLMGLPDDSYYEQFVPESGWVLRALVFWESIPPIMQPTLVVAGRYDKLLPCRTQEAIARRHNAELMIVPHGHIMMLEPDWPETVQGIFMWIKDHIRVSLRPQAQALAIAS